MTEERLPAASLITSEDWEIINDITVYVYSANPYPELNIIIRKLAKMIPFSHSFSNLTNDDNKNVEFFAYQSDDIPVEHLELYRTHYIHYDFVLWYSASPKEMSIRESDLIVEKYMAESIFMKEWMEPIGAYYGAMSNIAAGGYSYGNITLYRSKEEGNFTDREIAIMETVNHHLCLRLRTLFPNGLRRNSFDRNKNIYKITYHLTDRESEVIQLVLDGVTRKDLSKSLYISENTLKKHLNNIYSKMNVRNFEELLMIVRPGIRYMK